MFPNQPETLPSDDEVYLPSDVQASKSAGLRLLTGNSHVDGMPYNSGEVSTRGLFSQQYGHFEMQARVPMVDGMWPAFWLLAEDNSWPPEIDILEYIWAPWGDIPSATNQSSYANVALHWANGSKDEQFDGQYSTPWNWGSNWHTFAVDWRPGSLLWEIDGKVVNCVVDTPETGQRVPAKPMFLIVNDAVSKPGGWPGTIQATQTFPVEFDISYVRVWSFKDLPQTPPPATGAVRNTTLSAYTVAPGAKVQIHSNLVTGNTALGESESIFQIKSWDGATSYASIYVGANLPANATVPVTASWTVPANMAPGQYVISVWTAYNNWKSDFYNPEAQVITIKSP